MNTKNFPISILVTTLFLLFVSAPVTFAQTSPSAKPADAVGTQDVMTQLFDFSRPGEHHSELLKLSGTWNFQDAKRFFIKGTLVRKSIYDDRFFSVEITGGKLKVPVANGQMKEEPYQSRQIEGYDNPRMKFVMISINNHIGSDIQIQTGTFDSAKKEFTYEWESELIRGQQKKNKRILRIIDDRNYVEEYYEVVNGKEVKVRELNYTKES